MDPYGLHWTIIYVALLSFSTLASLGVVLFSFQHRQTKASAAQYIMYSLCWVDLVYSVARLVFYTAELINFLGVGDLMERTPNGHVMGARGIYNHAHGNDTKGFALIVVLIGDFMLMCSCLWATYLAHELRRLISKTMDRGKVKEKRRMWIYSIQVYSCAFTYSFGMGLSTALEERWEDIAATCLLAFQLTFVWISFCYPFYCALRISFINHFSRRPVNPASLLLYRRIKNLALCYLLLVFPSCLVELLTESGIGAPTWAIGLSQSLYYLSGGIEPMVIGLSASCCYQTLEPMMPVTVYDKLVENGYFCESQLIERQPVPPPLHNPIFVCTDIQSSTMLWANCPDSMSEAQSLHDDLLRNELLRFNGYEITTCGDAFQLAFHRVADAVQWCLSVQAKLVKTKWPSELVKQDPASKVTNAWGKAIFNGLRVRMAIHKGDDTLVCSKHLTTGKMTYLGISELVSREIVDLVKGGQILITEDALHELEKEKAEVQDLPTTHFSTAPGTARATSNESDHSGATTASSPPVASASSSSVAGAAPQAAPKPPMAACKSAPVMSSTGSSGSRTSSGLGPVNSLGPFAPLWGTLRVEQAPTQFDSFTCTECGLFERHELATFLQLYQVTPVGSALAERFPRDLRLQEQQHQHHLQQQHAPELDCSSPVTPASRTAGTDHLLASQYYYSL